MIKFKQGHITNPKTEETKDIIVKAMTANNVKDIVIGGGLVVLGIGYLTSKAFRNGSRAYEKAEWQTFVDLDLVED